MNIAKQTSLLFLLLMVYLHQQAQQKLDVHIQNVGNNKIQIVGVATAPGFSASPENHWATMNLSWRVPKSATIPTPAVAPPAPTPEVTGETTEFTGTSPVSAFSYDKELVMFDLTTFNQPDDDYWYFQVTQSVELVQNIAAGDSVVLYEFSVPITWTCLDCVEILTEDIPGVSFSTISYIDNGGLGTDVLNLVDPTAPLPVEWMYVKAEPKNNQMIVVSWATATEQQNAGFEVERSEDGRTYRSIARMPGSGNSATPKHYSFNDQQVQPGVKYYYRIKQKDLDGRARYSIIVIGRILEGNQFVVDVRPNPVRYQLNLDLQSSRKQTVQIVISDVAGKVYRMERGVTVESVSTRYSQSVAGYPPGTYLAKVIAQNGTVQTVKFIISR